MNVSKFKDSISINLSKQETKLLLVIFSNNVKFTVTQQSLKRVIFLGELRDKLTKALNDKQ